MRLLSIAAESFLAYEDLDLDLSGVDRVAIVGPVGSGKSSLLDAVSWSLWGDARGEADSLIRHGADRSMASTTWLLPDGRTMKVTRWRTRGHRAQTSLNLEVDGEDVSGHTIADTQEAIDRLVGATAKAVMAGPFMVQGRSDELMRLGPAPRKELLMQLLGLDRFKRLHRTAADAVAMEKAAQSALDAELERLEPQADSVLERKRTVNALAGAVAESRDELASLIEESSDVQAEAAVLVDRQQRAATLVSEMQAAQRQADRLGVTIQSDTIGALQMQRDNLVKQASLLEDVPCHGEGEYAACQLLAHAQGAPERLAQLDAAIYAAQEESDAANALRTVERDAALARVASLNAERMRLAQDETRQQEVKDRLTGLTAQIQTARAELEHDETELTNQRMALAVAEEAHSRVAEIQAELRTKAESLASWELVAQAFGRDGVPTMILEQSLDAIETRANEMLSEMPSGFHLSLETQRELKSVDRKRETLDVVLTVGGYEQDYALASGGERMQIDFALRVALADLLSTGFATMWLDEGWGSQDKDGREALVRGLEAVDTGGLQVVVSHLDDVADRFPDRLTVSKAGGSAHVELQ